MGERGPAPTPTSVLKYRGSWRAKEREKAGEPTPEMGIPDPPAYLKGPALEKWNELAPQLNRMGVLAIVDAEALGRYCRTWARWCAAEDFIAKHGTVYPIMGWKPKPGGGYEERLAKMAQHPQVREASDLADKLGRLEREFGLTPSARARIRTGGADEGLDEFEREIKRRVM